MSLRIGIWKPNVAELNALTRYERPLHRSVEPYGFGLFQTWRSDKNRPHRSRMNPFVLPPHSKRYLTGYLAVGKDGRLVLGVAEYLSAAHAVLGELIASFYGLGRKAETGSDLWEGEITLWGGELYFRNDTSKASVGTLHRANNTSGYIQKRLWMSNKLSDLKEELERESFPFYVADDVSFEAFNQYEQHLDPEINERFAGSNIRYDLGNALGLVKLIFMAEKEPEALRERLVKKAKGGLNVLHDLAQLVRRHNAYSPELLEGVLSAKQLTDVPTEWLEITLKKLAEGIVLLERTFIKPCEGADVIGEYDIFELPG